LRDCLDEANIERMTGPVTLRRYPDGDMTGEGRTNTGTDAFPEDLRSFVDRERWTYAKTMPEWPHEYLVRERVDPDLFEATVKHIRANGYEGRFYQKKITYYEEAGLVYWTMGAPLEETVIINRCRKGDTFESRSENGTLPPDRFVRPSDGPDLVEKPRGGGEG
jgi:hypothetical protein